MSGTLRDVEISPPTFDTFEESLEYAERFRQPQVFIDQFADLLRNGLKFSARLKYDQWLSAAGSAVISAGQEAIKIGQAALIRDSELFKTIVHEEMHLRLIRKAREGRYFALNLVTDPDPSVEENYVEDIAVRYLRMYQRAFGKLKH